MIATVTHHDILLILAIVMFFVAAVLHVMAKNVTAVLLCAGLAVFAWSFLATT